MIILSIITVTKNCVNSLGETLNSVSAIKTRNIEYIIVDGASTDGTVELVKDSDGLVDKFLSEPDSGIYNAMNKGLDLAVGKYILFINGDDELVSKGFLHVWPLLMNGRIGVITAKTRVLGEGESDLYLIAKPWLLLFFNSVPHPSTFVLTSLMRRYRFREDLRIASDYDLFLRFWLDGNRFAKINVTTALHYRGGASANSALSSDEMAKVRLERLGKLKYLLLNIAWGMYRIAKAVLLHPKR